MKITKRRIEEEVCANGRPRYLWDDQISGFGVKLLPSGKKRFIYKYRPYGAGSSSSHKWMTLGTFGEIPVEKARSLAQEIAVQVASGRDPQEEKNKLKAAPTLSDAWQKFLASDLQRRKPGTIRDYNSIWANSLGPKLGKKKVKDLSRADVQAFHNSMSETPVIGNRAVAVLSKLMSLTEAWEWRQQGTNPCKFIQRYPENKRERYLSQAELKRLGAALIDLEDEGEIWPDMANLFRLLLLTGARRSELTTCEWAWVQWDRSVIELPDSKTGKKTLYLSDAAIDALTAQHTIRHDPHSKFVFPGRRKGKCIVNISKPWARVCERAELIELRIHDLRHTAASIAVGQGIALPVIGRLLGHSQTQTTARYAHVDTDPALRAANVLGEVLGEII